MEQLTLEQLIVALQNVLTPETRNATVTTWAGEWLCINGVELHNPDVVLTHD